MKEFFKTILNIVFLFVLTILGMPFIMYYFWTPAHDNYSGPFDLMIKTYSRLPEFWSRLTGGQIITATEIVWIIAGMIVLMCLFTIGFLLDYMRIMKRIAEQKRQLEEQQEEFPHVRM